MKQTNYRNNRYERINPVTIDISPPEFTEPVIEFQEEKQGNSEDYDNMRSDNGSYELIKPVKIEVVPPESPVVLPEIYSDSESLKPIEPITIKADAFDDMKDDVSINIDEYIRIFDEQHETDNKSVNPPKKQKKQKKIFVLISDLIFYFAIAAVMFSVLASGPNGGEPRVFMGYSYFTVLTGSMQDEIPKGSFILVHSTDPQKLKVGDNITFMLNANTTVTHKIINIYENYENSGARGFQTKGVNNSSPDKDIVFEANVVGKVIFSVPMVGAIISSLKNNIFVVFIMFGLCIALSFFLRILFAKPKTQRQKISPIKI